MIARRRSSWYWAALAAGAIAGVGGVVVDSARLVELALVMLAALAAVAAMFAYTSTAKSSRSVRRELEHIRKSVDLLIDAGQRSEGRLDVVQRRIDQFATGFDARLNSVDDRFDRLDSVAGRLGEAVAHRDDEAALVRRQIRRSVNSVIERIDERMTTPIEAAVAHGLEDAGFAQQMRALRHEPITEIDALLQLHRRFGVDDAAPLVWGWAMSPRGILQLVDLVTQSGHRRILECGPGTSTVYVGRALQRVGGGRLIAIEHHAEFAEASRSLMTRLGLDDVVDVRLAELVDVEVDGEIFRWYDPASIVDVDDVDLLVIDGPPAKTGPNARLPAMSVAGRTLASSAVVILDDTNRFDEQAIVDRWLADARLTRGTSTSPDQALLHWFRPGGSDPLEGAPQVS